MARTDRAAAAEILENDLWAFAKYINPHYCYGDIHETIFRELANDEEDYLLILLPRGHLKSHCIAVWCVWQITKDPTATMVYLSAGEDLAAAQIYAIKGMITCDRYRALWPDMINKEESKREKWTAMGFIVDHPQRKKMGIRDMTIIIKTVKSNAAGLHCDYLVFDDVVTDKNAYTELGRREVKASVSMFASIKNPGAKTKGVGTRYHPRDLYYDFKNARVPVWVEDFYGKGKGEFDGEEDLWFILEEIAETSGGDLTGDYLWPRTISAVDGKPYGFDPRTLSAKRAEFFSLGENAQFYAQYYNDPNDPSSESVDRDAVQYYNAKHVLFNDGSYYYKDRKLNVFAAMDVAWTVNTSSDYTAIAVIGVDWENNIYVLGLDRFKTKDFDTYYKRIINLQSQWGFRKIHIESNAGGIFVANEVKRLAKLNGANLVVKPKAATANEGKKEERHLATLIPRVKNGGVYFTKGGLTNVIIEEIVLERPPHDDLKDSLTQAIEISYTPSKQAVGTNNVVRIRAHKRFGGLRRA